jgi:hypothetical protein
MCDKPAGAFARVFLVRGPSRSYGGLDGYVGSRHSSASIWHRQSLRRTGASFSIDLVNIDLQFDKALSDVAYVWSEWEHGCEGR